MTPEEIVFTCKCFDAAAAERFGFVEAGDGYLKYEADVMGGDFHAVVTVAPDGAVMDLVVKSFDQN